MARLRWFLQKSPIAVNLLNSSILLVMPLICASMVFAMLLINPYAGYVQAGLVGAFLFVGFSGEAAVFGKGAVRAHVDAKRAQVPAEPRVNNTKGRSRGRFWFGTGRRPIDT